MKNGKISIKQQYFLFQEPWKRQIEDESRMFLFPSDDNLLSNSGGRRRSHGYYSHHYQQQQQHLQPPPQNKAMKSNTNGGGGTVSRIFLKKNAIIGGIFFKLRVKFKDRINLREGKKHIFQYDSAVIIKITDQNINVPTI